MGFFTRTRDQAVQNLPAQYDDVRGRVVAGSNAAIDKATQIYRRNPKLIGGLALVASALLLNKMRGGARR
jgi:hypothetical protein